MGRYTGPKGRVNRRLGALVFENAGAARALERRETPPGMHGRRKKLSNYGIGFVEKQKIKFYYGLRDRHLRNYFAEARRLPGNTGETMLILCERRLDNVVRRAGFTVSRMQARQGITHSHFQLNGRTVDIPSIQVKVGDVISIRPRPNIQALYRGVQESGSTPHCNWLQFDAQGLTARVVALPTFEDVSLPVNVGQVVVFLSR